MSYPGLPAGFVVQGAPDAPAGLPAGFQVVANQAASAPPSASHPSPWMDAIKGFGSGLLQNLNPFLTDSGPLQLGENDPQFAESRLPAAETAQAVPGSTYQPQTGYGHYAQTAGNLAPTLLGGEASIPARILGRVLLPAAVGEAAGNAEKGTPYEGAARAAGEIVGGSPAGIVGGARAGAKGLAKALADQLPQEDANLVTQYEKMGGNLRPGQYSPSSFVRQGDAVVADTPWPRVSGFAENSLNAVLPAQQADQFNTLLSKTFGENAPRITDKVLSDASARIGKVYETVLPRNSVSDSEALRSGIAKIEDDLATVAPGMKPADVTRASAVINRVNEQLSSGGIPGKVYQTYRQRGGLLDELAGSDSPGLKAVGTNLRQTLDDAFAAQAQGTDAAALEEAKQQWRNLQVIKPLAAKAPTGNISPGLLIGAVNNEFGSPSAAGDLGTLARVGSAFLKAQPSSGTAERTLWRALINKPFSEGLPAALNSAFSLPISASVSRVINQSINSPEMRKQLLARALQGGNTEAPTNAGALIGALNQYQGR